MCWDNDDFGLRGVRNREVGNDLEAVIACANRLRRFRNRVELECRKGALGFRNPKEDLPRSAEVDDNRALREKERDRD